VRLGADGGEARRAYVDAMEASRLHTPQFLPGRAGREAHPDSWRTQLRWFGAAAVVGFAVPYLGSSTLELQHDVYLAAYFAAGVALFAAYVRSTRLDLRATLTRHWSWAACSVS
jgi:hypothetical protein